MKSKIMTGMLIAFLVLGLTQVALNFTPIVFAEPGPAQREVWKLVNITNTLPYNTLVDLNVTVNSRNGVNIACSNGTTAYFENASYWQGLGYTTYEEWMNGTSTLVYHWGEMKWFVSNGSLTPITYNEIQFWGPMYFDSGGGVSYSTFMGNTYMADWNLSDPNNEPDIISQAYWQGNQIKIIDDLMVPNNTMINVVVKMVLTQTGGYTFNLTATPGVTLSPSTWTIGGFNTILVPYDYTTIQAAINAANPGHTIVVYDGLYTEDLSVPSTKTNLDIKTYTGASVTIKGVQNVPAASFPIAAPNIAINATGVKLHGFTIESPSFAAGFYSSGIVIGAPNVEIFDNTFKVIAGTSDSEISQGIQTWHRDAVPNVDISGLNIHNNTFTHLNDGAYGYEAIYLNLDTGNNTVTIWNNTFSGKLVRAITTERSNVSITDNRVITDFAPGLPGGYQGINIGGVNSGNLTNISVVGNTIKGSGTGSGFSYGIKIGYADTSALTAVSITNNTIQMNEVGIRVRYSASGIKIRWNNFDNNTNFAVLNQNTTQTLDAAYNWWGNGTGPHHATLNPDGTGNEVSDYVIFEPWLIKPQPPVTPVSVVYVDPSSIALQAPALGTTFTVNVMIANVTMLYGYQFTLKWNSTLLNMTSAIKRIPTVWGNNYFISQETGPLARIGNYTLAVSARVPAPTFNGTTSVATLSFVSAYDPVFPLNVSCSLALENVTIADPSANAILSLVYSGNYSCYSVKPKLLFLSSEYSAKKVPTEFKASVNVTSVVNLYAFNFTFTFNTTLLNVLTVNVPVLGGSPTVLTGWDNSVGYVYVNVTGISPANGTRVIAEVTFKVQTGYVWSTVTPTINGTLDFSLHNLSTQDGTLIDHEAISGKYVYKPVPGDLTMDGYVELVDLVTAAQSFGTSVGDPLYDTNADLNRDGTINIQDIILVAHNFGRTEP